MNTAIKKLEKIIAKAKPEEQRIFLARLSKLLNAKLNEAAWTKLTEPSFDFWNNREDEIYNKF